MRTTRTANMRLFGGEQIPRKVIPEQNKTKKCKICKDFVIFHKDGKECKELQQTVK